MIPQQKEYTCGVAALRMALKKYNIHFKDEETLEEKLETTKEYGTDINSILLFLNSLNIIVRNHSKKSNSGLVLVNTSTWSNNFPEDGQNGHWVYFVKDQEDLENVFVIFDPYTSKEQRIKKEELLQFTKDIKIKNKIYSDIFLYI